MEPPAKPGALFLPVISCIPHGSPVRSLCDRSADSSGETEGQSSGSGPRSQSYPLAEAASESR